MMNQDPFNSIERQTLEAFWAERPEPRRNDGVAGWLAFGLRSMLEVGKLLRADVGRSCEGLAFKGDGSPVTALEQRIEAGIVERLAAFEPAAAFVGEESGGELPESGWCVTVDPVDGTWAYLTGSISWTSTLAVLRDGRVIAGFVVSPGTGELAYALEGRGARLMRLSSFGEPAGAVDLPEESLVVPDVVGGERLIVNFHPDRTAERERRGLMAAWNRGELGVVRATGGSPAWGLFEAARGHTVYANTWSKGPTRPFDLAAGVLLVRSAGGDVTDLGGTPIDELRHVGHWVAGLSPEHRERVAAILSASR